MTLELVRATLGWCAIINMGILMWWFLFIVFAGDFVFRLHCKFFNLKMTQEQFNAIHYTGIMVFKLLVFGLNVVPYLALCIVG
jgi:hypothetical protein